MYDAPCDGPGQSSKSRRQEAHANPNLERGGFDLNLSRRMLSHSSRVTESPVQSIISQSGLSVSGDEFELSESGGYCGCEWRWVNGVDGEI